MFIKRNKILVTPLSVVVVLLIIISIIFGVYTTKSLKRNKIEDFQQTTKNKTEKAVAFLRSIENDIIFLGNNLFLLNMIDAIAGKDTDQIKRLRFEVENLFKTFSESRKIYEQIRYIDRAGREIVRVNLEEKSAFIVPSEELQDKSRRYYFKEAMSLKEGNIYVSQLDLNIEYGEIELPHKPMLRYSIPVFDREKRKRGILVLNVLADFLLKNILAHEYIKDVDSFLLDKRGFYLLHPEISKRWGDTNCLNTGENLKNDFPQEAVSLILSGQSGSELIKKQILNFIPIHFDPLNNARYWIFMERLHKSIVYSPIYNFLVMLGTLVLLLIVGLITSSSIFSNRLRGQLKELVRGTIKIAGDNLKHPITVGKKKDVIKELAESFNLMMNSLRESKEKNNQLFLLVKKSKDRWQQTFNAITDIITIHDKDFRIIDANKAFFEIFSVSKEQLSNMKCNELFHCTDEHWHSCPLAKSAKSLKPEIEEVDDHNMGGVFLVSAFPIKDKRDEIHSFVLLAKDVTFQKRLQRQLIDKTKKLEMANKELKNLAYIITELDNNESKK
ncbi:MAG: PAS domain S-box protein [Candidatus Scalinduaceae bacterium]